MLTFALVFIFAFATIVFFYSLISHRFEGTLITAPMVFVAAGLLFSPAGLDVVDPAANNSLILIIAEIALVLTLFSDASRINFRALKRGALLPVRLLLIGLPLTVAMGGLIAAGLFSGITLAEAALVGAILAPTDAGLGQSIVNSPKIPVRIRQTLNVESGLNDGGTLPFFYFFLFLAVATFLEIPEQSWLLVTVELIGIGIIVGILTGFLGGLLIDTAVRKEWMTGKYQWIGFLSLALIAWVAAEGLGGSGFIAAFTGGLAMASRRRNIGEETLGFTEAGGELLDLAVFFILGLVAPQLLDGMTGTVLLYAVLSLTLIRMIPVAVSLIGTRLNQKTVLFIGWFGPRGLASIVLLLIVFDEAPSIAGLATIQMVIVTTILISVFAHGMSAAPLIDRYAGVVESLPDDAPEREDVPVGPTRRRTSSRGEKQGEEAVK
jgi:NhaP-type Na+/H+ or K+/H+ antiporter